MTKIRAILVIVSKIRLSGHTVDVMQQAVQNTAVMQIIINVYLMQVMHNLYVAAVESIIFCKLKVSDRMLCAFSIH